MFENWNAEDEEEGDGDDFGGFFVPHGHLSSDEEQLDTEGRFIPSWDLFCIYFWIESELFQTSASDRIKEKQAAFEKMRKKKLRRPQTIIQEVGYDNCARFQWDTEPITLVMVSNNCVHSRGRT